MRVEVYFNLHKHTFSVRSCKTGRVLVHTDKVHIANPKFVVRQSGRNRVLREGRKNVHAFVRGEVTYFNDIDDAKRPMLDNIKYNPYKYVGFVKMPDETLIHDADRAYMLVSDDGVPSIYAEGARY